MSLGVLIIKQDLNLSYVAMVEMIREALIVGILSDSVSSQMAHRLTTAKWYSFADVSRQKRWYKSIKQALILLKNNHTVFRQYLAMMSVFIGNIKVEFFRLYSLNHQIKGFSF
ncbi:MAG TPA: hypothetical protein DCG38_10030 [Eubacteriaceae bacterium]|nr:hypothetical protein [Eubacteriaceae bacterium]